MIKYFYSLFISVIVISIASHAHAMEIVPSFSDVATDKNQTVERTIRITNDEAQDMRVSLAPTAIQFDPTGRPQFTDNAKNVRSMIGWISVDNGPYLIPPGKSQDVPFTIKVPSDAAAGGYYGSLVITKLNSQEPGKDVDIALSTRVASLLFVTIGSKTRNDALAVEHFTVPRQLYLAPPIKFLVTLKNTTDIHLQPHGTVDLTNTFTGKRTARLLVNEDSLYLFPNTEKSFQLIWKPSAFSSFWPLDWGRYTAALKVSAADSSDQTAVVTFWILPHYILVIGLLIIIGLGYASYRVHHKVRKRRNERAKRR